MQIAHLLKEKPVNSPVEINGWIKSRRDSKNLSFLDVTDGSCLQGLQVIADAGLPNYENEILKLTAGCSIQVTGILAESPAKGQALELQAQKVIVYGWADPAEYPLQKKRHSFEFLRSLTHLRARTNSLGAMARIRSKLSFAISQFFQERGFIQIHTPIITTSDCEGAGEMFTVTSFDLDNPVKTDGHVDFGQDFFGQRASLTVSGQLEAEAYALALGNVYTFGPTFRAENSNTSRHLAEFWMLEPEMAFCNLDRDMDLAEEMLQHLVRVTLDECSDDINLFGRFINKDLIPRLTGILDNTFVRMTYTEAIAALEKSGRDFEFPIAWGMDLQSEHERFLAEELCKRPVIVKDYPKKIKPFYMRVNDDNNTVAAMDILFPGIGEIIGGSQREERFDILMARMIETGIDPDTYSWYLDLRRFGSAPHAGFGLGFERLILFVTGLGNIRDVIPFPRTPGSASM